MGEDRDQAGDPEHGADLTGHVEDPAPGAEAVRFQRGRARTKQRGNRQADPGTTEQLGDPNGTIGLFVRHTGDNQTYLARSVFTPAGDLLSWLNNSVIDLGAARIQQVTVTPPKGTGYTVTRAKDSDLKFTLANPPKTGTPNQQMLDAVPYAVSSFSLEDVQPVASVDFSAKPRRR